MLYGRRQSKPNPGVAIDLSHPLAVGLVAFWVFNEGSGLPYNLISGNQASSNTMVWSPSPVGQSLTGNGVSSAVLINAPTPWLDVPGGPVSIVAYCSPASTGVQCIYGGWKTSTPFPGMGLRVNLSKNGNLAYWPGNISVNATIDGNWHVFGVSQFGTGTNQVSLYEDGRPIGTGTAGFPTSWTGSRAIGANYDGTAQNLNGGIAWIGIWSRALSDKEHASLTNNPWQIFQPSHNRLFPPAVAFSATGNLVVTPRHGLISASATSSVPVYSGVMTRTRHPSCTAAGTHAIPAYAGTATFARHPSYGASAQASVPIYSGTSTASRRPSYASTAAYTPQSYAGVCTVSASGEMSSSASSSVPTYLSDTSLARAIAIGATGESSAPGFSGSCTVTTRHPLPLSSSDFAMPAYAGRMTISSRRATFSSSSISAVPNYRADASLFARVLSQGAATWSPPLYIGSGRMTLPEAIFSAAAAYAVLPVYANAASLAVNHPIFGSEGVNNYVAFAYSLMSYVVTSVSIPSYVTTSINVKSVV